MLMMRDKGRDEGAQKPGKTWSKPELVRLDPDSPKAMQAKRKFGLID